MATTASISQSSDGLTLTYTYVTDLTPVTASLSIYDSNGTLLTTINMGTNLSTTYGITADVYLTFVLNVNTGAATVTTNYISTQFYKNAQAQLASFSNLPCGCTGTACSSLVKAREAINSATTYYAVGDAQNSQLMLNAADYYVLNPTY